MSVYVNGDLSSTRLFCRRRIGINDVALTMDLSAKSQEAQLRHAQILQNLEVRRRIHSVVVPTLMKDVKAKLRELGAGCET